MRVCAPVCKARRRSVAGARRAAGGAPAWSRGAEIGSPGAAGVWRLGGCRSGRRGWDLRGSRGAVQTECAVRSGDQRGPAGTRLLPGIPPRRGFSAFGLDPRAVTQPGDSRSWRCRGRGSGCRTCPETAPKPRCCSGERASSPWTSRCLGSGRWWC